MTRHLPPPAAVGYLFLTVLAGQAKVSGQAPSANPADFIEVKIPVAPAPLKANGKIHLLYELHIANMSSFRVDLIRVNVFGDDPSAKPLATYSGQEMENRFSRPQACADLRDDPSFRPRPRSVMFLQLIFDAPSTVPKFLHHRLVFTPLDPDLPRGEIIIERPSVVINQAPPTLIRPPLQGAGWVSANGLSNNSDHRRALIKIDCEARIAQRFATDWTKLGPDGLLAHDDPSKNENWYGYGAEVLAVADATVVEIKDQVPENVPLTEQRAVPITLDTIGGNYVMLDLGNSRFALYAHLQPGSIRVHLGDKVSHGQVLGLLGNSGNSDAPHLHFHITDAKSPLGAEGVPYVVDAFEIQGTVGSLEALVGGEAWKPAPDAMTDRRRWEMPLISRVVRFP